MKKAIKILLAMLCVLTMVMSFTACDIVKGFFGIESTEETSDRDRDERRQDKEEEETEEKEKTASTSDISLPDESTSYSSAEQQVADYVARNRSAVLDSLSGDSYIMDLLSQGTAVVYNYTYTDPSVSGQAVTDALKDSMEKQESYLNTMLTTIQSECSAVTAVIYNYYEADGDLLYSYTID